MKYKPQPIDVSDIELDDSLQGLVEKLAKNTHDIWAVQRHADGWCFGKERDDAQKQHPCLVNYADLPEEEKEYDRKVSAGVIKTMLKMGYKIHNPEQRDSHSAEDLDEETKTLQSSSMTTTQLFTFWRNHNPARWEHRPDLYCLLGEKTLQAGEALLAYDILSQGLELLDETALLENPSDPGRKLFVRIQQQRALALAQSGAAEEAGRILQKLCHQGADDSETRSLLGRTYKDIATAEIDLERRRKKFGEAFSIYHQAYLSALKKNDTDQAYYNGINAATLALLSGDSQTSDALARTVTDLCLSKLKDLGEVEVSPWLYATLGEAHLLTGNQNEAKRWYRKGTQKAQGAIRDIASMRKQARVILQEAGEDISQLEDCFQIPTVIAFTGHMIDLPDRAQKRFPEAQEPRVRDEISRKLAELNAGIAYASATCGADIIFLEEMLKRGGEINIILPFKEDKFIETSANTIPGSNWIERFNDVKARAAKVQILGYYDASSNNQTNFEFANLFLYGAAVARSQTLDTPIHTLAVWDGQIEGLTGGTAATVCHWRSMPHQFNGIHPLGLGETQLQKKFAAEIGDSTESLAEEVQHHTFLPMLFADVKGYSKLTEQQVVSFSVHFLEKVAAVIDQFEAGLLSKRTQGDGLFLVFKDLRSAVNLALELKNKTTNIDWSKFGLPTDLLFRISLDAGPCYSYVDPIVDKTEFCGAYVVRAARMEPITPPGEIYASESFVALAHATALSGVRFDYAGQVALPKNYGVIPVSHVRQLPHDCIQK
jgi:class 3 adenylate cyclase